MRHTFGFILGVLLAPGLLYGSAWGFSQAAKAVDVGGEDITDRTRLYGALAMLAAVGLVMGIVIVARWASPLAALLPALGMIGLTIYFLASPGGALDLAQHVPPAGDLDAALRALLASGIYGLMGFALLVPAWTPRRWAGGDEEGGSYF